MCGVYKFKSIRIHMSYACIPAAVQTCIYTYLQQYKYIPTINIVYMRIPAINIYICILRIAGINMYLDFDRYSIHIYTCDKDIHIYSVYRRYGVATISRPLKITGLCCKRDL